MSLSQNDKLEKEKQIVLEFINILHKNNCSQSDVKYIIDRLQLYLGTQKIQPYSEIDEL